MQFVFNFISYSKTFDFISDYDNFIRKKTNFLI